MPWSYARGQDVMTVPWLDRVVAHGIPRARFELLEAAAHQPFQEDPDQFNARDRHVLA